jgi:hypothetical protein
MLKRRCIGGMVALVSLIRRAPEYQRQSSAHGYIAVAAGDPKGTRALTFAAKRHFHLQASMFLIWNGMGQQRPPAFGRRRQVRGARSPGSRAVVSRY